MTLNEAIGRGLADIWTFKRGLRPLMTWERIVMLVNQRFKDID